MVVRRFKKCGISLPLDGSENKKAHIESIKYYQFKKAYKITELQLESECKNQDEGEDDYNVEYDCSAEVKPSTGFN